MHVQESFLHSYRNLRSRSSRLEFLLFDSITTAYAMYESQYETLSFITPTSNITNFDPQSRALGSHKAFRSWNLWMLLEFRAAQ